VNSCSRASVCIKSRGLQEFKNPGNWRAIRSPNSSLIVADPTKLRKCVGHHAFQLRPSSENLILASRPVREFGISAGQGVNFKCESPPIGGFRESGDRFSSVQSAAPADLASRPLIGFLVRVLTVLSIRRTPRTPRTFLAHFRSVGLIIGLGSRWALKHPLSAPLLALLFRGNGSRHRM
jgi:hypothetical protein